MKEQIKKMQTPKELLQRGRTRGFLMQSEVAEVFSDLATKDFDLEVFVFTCEHLEIEIRD